MFHLFRKQAEKLASPYAKYIETPKKEEADFAIPCFILAKEMKKQPNAIADELAKKFSAKLTKQSLIKEIRASGPYVNFYGDWQKIGNMALSEIMKKKERFGRKSKKIKVLVEYAHPNTHKLFHIGHLRNIATGESLSRILEFCGFDVKRANYQGDVGLHIAKCLWGIKKLGMPPLRTLQEKIGFLGEAYSAGSRSYEEDSRAKQEITRINRQIYGKHQSIARLWKETRQWSLEYFDRIYKRVYTRFDRLYFESETAEKGLKIAKRALRHGILKESEGAVIFDGAAFGLDKRVFISKLGLPTYEAKELGLAEMEFTESGHIDRCIHVAGPEQGSFFRVTFKVEELLNPAKFRNKQLHLAYGWVRLKEGKMSSRLGNVVEGEWLLDELKKQIMSKYLSGSDYPANDKEAIAEAIAVGAAKYYFLKHNVASEISFDAEEAVSVEGDTGPYLQYTYARAASIISKSRKKMAKSISPEGKEIALLKKISMFPETVYRAGEDLKPNCLANYLFELASVFNEFYHEKQVIGSEREEQLLLLVYCFSVIMKSGLELLGIRALEKM